MQRIAAARRQPGDKHPALHYKEFLPHQRVSNTQAAIHRLFLCAKVNSSDAGKVREEIMQQIVTHKGTLYSVRKLADGHTWRLAEIGCPRNSFPMSRKHMILAGFGHVEGVKR